MPASNSTGRTASANAAAGFMLTAMICHPSIPLLVAVGNGAENPLLFSGVWRVGASVSYAAFLGWFYRPLLNRGTLSLIGCRIVSQKYRWLVMLTFVSSADYALFALSTKFVDVAVTSALFETWPIITMFILSSLYGRKVSRSTILLTLMCFVGFVFITASQTGGFVKLSELLVSSPVQLIAGFAPAVAAVIVMSLSVCSFKCGSLLAKDEELRQEAEFADVPHALDRFGTVIIFVISNLFSIPLSIFGGIIININTESDFTFGVNLIAISFGGVFLAVGAILWQTANARASNVGINAMGYLTPIFSLVLLWAFSKIGNIDTPYLIMGAIGIIAANLLLNFEAERLLGFKALVLALWACDTAVYLRDSIQPEWTGVGSGYFEALALSATVFTLILSFRVARLANRTRDEDNRTFALFYEMRALSARGVVSPALCECVLTIDSAQGPELRNAYAEARRYIAMALRRANRTDRDKLVAAQAQLDALAHSRQQGINFGELCALFIFAGITVGLALFLRPESSGLTGFLIEMFTMLFSSVIVFLAVNVFDLQRDRSARVLQRSDSGDYTLVFQDSTRRHIEQGITIAVGVLIVAAYAGLLGYKWLGWFS